MSVREDVREDAADKLADQASCRVLSLDIVEEHLPGQALQEATDLTLRSLHITCIGSALMNTPQLEVLSLSNNAICDLQGFEHLKNIRYLNLNFNRIKSLHGISACKQLQKLFLSNNHIMDLDPLASCQELECLSIFANQIANLNAVVFALGSLPKLSDLDLSGNPVATSPAYKHQLVIALSGLMVLDGECISSADNNLAMRFFAEHPEYEARFRSVSTSMPFSEKEELESGINHDNARGSFDPNRPTTPSILPKTSADLNNVTVSAPSDKFTKDNIKLFRDDFLNKHPILLEYIVDSAIASRPSSARPGTMMPRNTSHQPSASSPRGSLPPQRPHAGPRQLTHSSPSSAGRRRSFVERLRSMAAETSASNAEDQSTKNNLLPDSSDGNTLHQSALENELIGPKSSSSPHEVIRHLLRICSQLEEERDAAEQSLKTVHGRERTVLSWGETEVVVLQLEKLHEENRRLQAENKNMYLLLEENKRLQEEVKSLRIGTGRN